MYFVGLGLIFLIMKYLEIGFVAPWDWWLVLSPFGCAVVWWTLADITGYTKRKAVQLEAERQKERLRRNREAMGLNTKKRR